MLVGYGRVGRRIGYDLERVGASLFVIDERDEAVADFAPRGVKALAGTAQSVLPASNITKA